MSEQLRIGSLTYSKTGSPPLFRVLLAELDDVQLLDIPFYSTLTVENLPGTAETYNLDINFTHAGGPENEDFFLNCHVAFWQPGSSDCPDSIAACNRRLRHIKRAFRDVVEILGLDDGDGEAPRWRSRDKWYCGVLYSRNFTRAENPRLQDFVGPLVNGFQRLIATPDVLLFLCHASEDKDFVNLLAAYLDSREVPVWYDKREIGLGESIVARINAGLEAASHLVLVLSKASVSKQWVQKEFSAALMKHLRDRTISIVPVLRESCSIPALLADLKYADCRREVERGFRELADDVSSR